VRCRNEFSALDRMPEFRTVVDQKGRRAGLGGGACRERPGRARPDDDYVVAFHRLTPRR